jgi:hypothetical protein
MSALVALGGWRPFGTGCIAESLSDEALLARLQAYKRDIAGTYHGLSPGEIARVLPPGPCVVSEKIDGETWFLHRDGGLTRLLSPAGKAIAGVPVTDEAETLLGRWSGLMAGELYAACTQGRPRVFDLHAAMGGGALAQTDRLRFAAFDLLLDGEEDVQRKPYATRIARIEKLLRGGSRLHGVRCETVSKPAGATALFERIVTAGGAEGLVVHASNGRTFKVKPEISIDAAVIGYVGNERSISELLLALITPSGRYQTIGRVRTGWSKRENQELAARLAACACPSSPVASHRFEVVVEIRCNDLLAVDSDGEPIRRMAFEYGNDWTPAGRFASASMVNPVFVRIRDDKRAQRPDVRFEQVSDLVPVAPEIGATAKLPPSRLLRREVYTKPTRGGQAVRKLVGWATNKHEADPRFPRFAVLFTDYSPEREQPLKTELRVASCKQNLDAVADDWLAANIGRGLGAAPFRQAEAESAPVPLCADNRQPSHEQRRRTAVVEPQQAWTAAYNCICAQLVAAFPLVRGGSIHWRRSAPHVTRDDKGREACLELTLARGLVENARRIASLVAIILRWKTAEVTFDGEILGRQQLGTFLAKLERVRQCWLGRKGQGAEACRRSCKLGCDALRIEPSQDLGYIPSSNEPWFTVGKFDGKHVFVDKQALREQVAARRHAAVRLCPFFDPAGVAAAIDGLPDTLASDDSSWSVVYDNGKPAWLWPRGQIPPVNLSTTTRAASSTGIAIRYGSRQCSRCRRSWRKTRAAMCAAHALLRRPGPGRRSRDSSRSD